MNWKAGFVVISQEGRVCPYCNKAKELLDKHGYVHEDRPLQGEELKRAASAAYMNTVPIIYHGHYRIGGYADLVQYLLDNP